MKCQWHSKPEDIQPCLVEESILNTDFLPDGMKGWKRYRIEYGFECSCPEGIIYLPPWVDPYLIENIINRKY
jgi:hypothetical protein